MEHTNIQIGMLICWPDVLRIKNTNKEKGNPLPFWYAPFKDFCTLSLFLLKIHLHKLSSIARMVKISWATSNHCFIISLFLTTKTAGATVYIGGKALDAFVNVNSEYWIDHCLVWSYEKAKLIEEVLPGVYPFVGDLSDEDLLKKGVSKADIALRMQWLHTL